MRTWANQKIAVATVFVLAMVMNGLDATIVNPALLAISTTYGATPAASNMVEVSFLISFAIVIPVAGWLGDRWGSKRVFLAALALFTLASAWCGLAGSLNALVLARVLQGCGGGLLTPVGMAMMFRVFPPEERLNVSRFLTIPTTLAPALGPVLGGWLTDQWSWRWVFYINLPIGIIALLFGLIYLKEQTAAPAGRFDRLGFALAVPGFGLVLYALGAGSAGAGASPLILAAGLGGLALLVALVVVELRSAAPMLNLRLFRDPVFRNANLIAVLTAGGLLGMLYLFPLMYQDAIGASALDAGLTVFPEAIGLMLAAQVIGWSYPALGPRRLIGLGLLGAAGIVGLMTLVDQTTSPWFARGLLFGIGFFLGHAVMAVQTVGFATIEPAAMGQASALFNVMRQLGAGLGVALAAGVLASSAPGLGGYRLAMLACAAMLACSLIFALRMPKDEPLPALGMAEPELA